MATFRTVTPEQSGASTRPWLSQAEPLSSTQDRWRILSESWFKKVLFLVSDIFAILLAHSIAEALTLLWLRVSAANLEPPNYFLIYIAFFVATLHLFGGYRDFELRRPERELERDTKAILFFFAALLSANFVFFKSWEFSRYLVVCWCITALVTVIGLRFALRAAYAHLWQRGHAQQNALLIGTPERLNELYERLTTQRHLRHKVIGVLSSADCMAEHKLPWPILGNTNEWRSIVEQHDVKWLMLSLPEHELSTLQMLDILHNCGEGRVGIELHSDVFGSREFVYERNEFSGLFRFSARPRWSRIAHGILKFITDLLIGVVGSVITLLLTPAVALALKLEDGGPVFYRREFVDRDGNIHYYLKFRTMVRQADDWLQQDAALQSKYSEKHKLKHDPRVLPIGHFLRKFSIDEFPQFFSLLSGKLTFVGPRVISSAEKARYGEFLPKLLSVKPGMTGYWQVMGRQNTEYVERVRMDMFYIDHWSLWLDLIIIGKTFWQVLRAEGAY